MTQERRSSDQSRTMKMAENAAVTLGARLASIITLPVLGFLAVGLYTDVGDLKTWRATIEAQFTAAESSTSGKLVAMETWLANVARKAEDNASDIAVMKAVAAERANEHDKK